MLAIHHFSVHIYLLLLIYAVNNALIATSPRSIMYNNSQGMRVTQPDQGSIINSLTYLSM